ncbi:MULTISPECIES: methyl-accepting chemotaxis protein [Dickeya]|uniref:Methyl-accepting chemotaxis protein I (Serine chemoreceptor protein) n=1 Tax=Dickeya aquatica TaxID=1401087 RepID=A0A375AEF5_9GAMM|nr:MULTISPECIES: methyl-accepting chemotaxis protein [Dickeya]SLM64377.1 Methyl-accepting chemotaxis protein I (serine chemoreceptor protein) [Dickeya aquatica]
MLKRITVKQGLLALLAMMLVLLAVVAGIGTSAISQGNRSLQSVDKIQGKELSALSASYTATLRARIAAAQAVRLHEVGLIDKARESTGQVAQYTEASRREMTRFLAYGTVTQRGAELAEHIKVAYEAYDRQGVQPLLTALRNDDLDDYYTLMQDTLPALTLAMDTAINDFRDYALQVGENLLQQADTLASSRLLGIGSALCISILLAVLAWWAIRQWVLRPLDGAVQHLEIIAQGDLSGQIEEGRHNEIGRLIQAMRLMQASLSVAVGRVRDAGGQIDVGTRELASGNSHLAERTEESAASLEQTASSMEQLASTVKLNADNADQAYLLAKQVSDIADKGSEASNQMLEKMQMISATAARVADILTMIDGIAFQTNILALNAAVEAARAGEQGRGFAVVAGEVRNLAQRSAESAKEIKALMQDSQTQVNEGAEIARVAGETMNDVSSAVARVTTLMREISGATREQSNGIEQVNQAVSQMDAVAQQNASLVEQSAAATRSLEEQAHELAASMAQFRLSPQTANFAQALLK